MLTINVVQNAITLNRSLIIVNIRNVIINNSHIKLAVVVETTINAECGRTNIGNQMIDIFFDYFGYDKEHHFVTSIAYEYVIICHGMPRIITINIFNIIVLRRLVDFPFGDDGFLGEMPFGTWYIGAGASPPPQHCRRPAHVLGKVS